MKETFLRQPRGLSILSLHNWGWQLETVFPAKDLPAARGHWNLPTSAALPFESNTGPMLSMFYDFFRDEISLGCNGK